MKNITIFTEKNVDINLDKLITHLNGICRSIKFNSGTFPIALEDEIVTSPKSYTKLDKKILEKCKTDFQTLIFTIKPHENNFFWEGYKHYSIISFSGWNYLTNLPMNNGVVYFIASILSQEIDLTFRHEETTGCIYDFLWDKSAIDKGMRCGLICSNCLMRIKTKKINDEKKALFTDLTNILNHLSAASKWNEDVIDYWNRMKSNQPNTSNQYQDNILKQNDFIPTDNSDGNIEVNRGKIDALCKSYIEVANATIDNKGEAFEIFCGNFFNVISGWNLIDQNARLQECEIDLIYDISGGPEELKSRLGTHIYIECKNRKGKSDIKDLSHFIMNIKSRNLKGGIFFSYSGISGYSPQDWKNVDAAYRRIIDVSRKDNIYIIPFTSEDIELIKNGSNLVSHLIELHNRFVRV